MYLRMYACIQKNIVYVCVCVRARARVFVYIGEWVSRPGDMCARSLAVGRQASARTCTHLWDRTCTVASKQALQRSKHYRER
jgi:hypothetical protein